MDRTPASFTYVANPGRVVFGRGSLDQLAAELKRLGVRRALVLSTAEQAEQAKDVQRSIADLSAGFYTRAAMHTPIDVTTDAMACVTSLRCDGLVAFGGGSTIGLSKALALRTDLPQVAVPTTYAGSEMTSILGETNAGRKTTLRSPKVLPETVIYDVNLTLSLPVALSVTSGVNALAHAVEALYAQDANPVTSLMAEEGIAALRRSLPCLIEDSADLLARTDAQYGSWLCGACLGTVGMALHHKICHVLGGAFDLRHADTHTIMLPHVTAYNTAAAPDAMRRIARALNVASAASGLFALNRALGAPVALKDLGMPRSGVATAVDLVMQDRYWNPREPEAKGLGVMLERAWAGDPPAVY